jgi:hypothetical protein
MVVKQKPQYPKTIGGTVGIEVGDHVKVLGFSKKNSALLRGKNLRTGREGDLSLRKRKRWPKLTTTKISEKAQQQKSKISPINPQSCIYFILYP